MEKQQKETGTGTTGEPKKKGGRPGRRVTSKNFHDVLDYFRNQNLRYPSLLEPLDIIKEKSPLKHRSPEEADARAAYIQRRIDSLKESGSTAEIESLEQQLKHIKTSVKPITEEHIALLQEWVDKKVSREEWTKACTAIRQKRLKRSRSWLDRMEQIPVSKRTKRMLDDLKEELGGNDWSATLSEMVQLSREALKMRRSREEAAQTRKRNKLSR